MPLRYFAELIVLAALWGASFLFMRISVPEFGALVLIELRVLFAGLFLLPFWFRREPLVQRQQARDYWWPLFMVGMLNSAVPFVLFAYSTLYITGGFAAILNATAPVWAAVVAWVWLRKSISISGAIGLVIGFVGVLVLVSDTLSLDLDGKTLGALAALSAPILYGIAANYTSEKLSQVSPLTIATMSQLAAAALLLPISLFFLPHGEISTTAWLSVVALGVLCTSLAYLMYFRLIAHVGSSNAVTVAFLVPLFGMFWGAVFLNEQITATMVIGAAVILMGTALVTGVVKIKGLSMAR